MRAFLITCLSTKDRLPVAKEILLRSFEPTAIHAIKTFDAPFLNTNLLSKINHNLWKGRSLEIQDILIDNIFNAKSESEVTNGKEFVAKYKHVILHEPLCASNYPEWLAPRNLSSGEISVLFKHHCALSQISQGRESHGMIIEDDILSHGASDSMFQHLKYFIDDHNPDYVDIAGGANLSASKININSPNFTHMSPPRTRTNAGYVVSRRLAELLVENFFPLVFPIDWHLQYMLYKFATYPIHCFWMDKTLYLHGSETESYKSWRS